MPVHPTRSVEARLVILLNLTLANPACILRITMAQRAALQESIRTKMFSAFKICRHTSSTGQSSVTSAISSHTHWCTNTLCEKRREIRTCDGFKRHEKVHNMLYICMPYGPIETSAEGRGKCAFCGVQEPDQGHLLLHNVSLCIGKASRPLTKSRKADLLKRLALSRRI